MKNTLDLSFLKLFGLSSLEIEIYHILIEGGTCRATALVKQLKKPRTTIYLALGNLTEKGLVGTIEHSDARQFYIRPPEYIENLLVEKKELVQKNIDLYRKELPLLKVKIHSKNPVSFEYHDTKEALQYALKDMLLYKGIHTYALWPITPILETLGTDFFEEFNRKRIKEKIHVCAIWPHTRKIDFTTHPYLGTGKEFYREIGIAPKEIDCTMGYWIYENKAVCISSREDLFGFTVTSTEFVQMLKTQHEFIWNQSTIVKRVYGKSELEFLKKI